MHIHPLLFPRISDNLCIIPDAHSKSPAKKATDEAVKQTEQTKSNISPA